MRGGQLVGEFVRPYCWAFGRATSGYEGAAYNAVGRVDTLTYPTSTSGYRLKLQYDYTNGLATKIKDFNAPTTVIWSRMANDARGM